MKALIVGRAQGVWGEVTNAHLLTVFDLIICVNGAGVDYPGMFDCWVSYHGYYFPKWIKARRKKHPQLARLDDIEFWTSTAGRKVPGEEKKLWREVVEGGSPVFINGRGGHHCNSLAWS